MKTTRWAVSLDNITFKENEEKLFLRKKFLIWESHYIIRLASHIRIFLSKWLPVKIFFQSVNTPWNTQIFKSYAFFNEWTWQLFFSTSFVQIKTSLHNMGGKIFMLREFVRYNLHNLFSTLHTSTNGVQLS